MAAQVSPEHPHEHPRGARQSLRVRLNGVGESSPMPYYIQNLAEAEFVVATFMYMRLIGIAASRISIITTYNGQRDLIEDIMRQRCSTSYLYGSPAKIATTDKFQGQQNDFILLSLVRTKHVGHLKDVRRLVVAMSRARFGLYVFGRRALFEPSVELRPTFSQLLALPDKLTLLPAERHPTTRPADDVPTEGALVIDGLTEMGELVASFATQAENERREREMIDYQDVDEPGGRAVEPASSVAMPAGGPEAPPTMDEEDDD